MIDRELSLPAAEAESVTVTSRTAAASRLRQLSRTFHLQRSSSSSSPSSPSVDMLPVSLVTYSVIHDVTARTFS